MYKLAKKRPLAMWIPDVFLDVYILYIIVINHYEPQTFAKRSGNTIDLHQMLPGSSNEMVTKWYPHEVRRMAKTYMTYD